MTLLDAYALIALILGEPAMKTVRELIRDGKSAMTATNLAEVYDVTVRRYGLVLDEVVDIVEPLFEGSITPLPVGTELARRAADIRTRHYDRKHRAISLADAILLGAAGPGDRIATADSAVLDAAAALGIETVELPDQN